jgi:hypothetical protein
MTGADLSLPWADKWIMSMTGYMGTTTLGWGKLEIVTSICDGKEVLNAISGIAISFIKVSVLFPKLN